MHNGLGGNRYDERKFTPLIILVIGIVVLSALRVPWPIWMLFFMFSMPTIKRLLNRVTEAAQRGSWQQHRGNRYHTPHHERAPWGAEPHEKRKNGYTPQRVDDIDDMFNHLDDEYAYEKPKRRPIYIVGDDGELVEVMDEPPFEQPKAKRAGGNEDGYEYV